VCVLTGCSNDHAWGSTVGAQCTEVVTAICGRVKDACDAGTDGCVESSVPLCCQGLCKDIAISSEDDIRTCTVDIAGASCDLLSSSLPASCLGVVKLPK
jgi:hypothetical protein